MKWYVRVWPLDWWGVYQDSEDFNSYKEAVTWQSMNVKHYEDSCILHKGENDDILA